MTRNENKFIKVYSMGNEYDEEAAIVFNLNEISSIQYNSPYTYITLKNGTQFGVGGDSLRKLQLAMDKRGVKI